MVEPESVVAPSTLAALVRAAMPGVSRRMSGFHDVSQPRAWWNAWFADPGWEAAEVLYRQVCSIVARQALIGPVHAARQNAFPGRAGRLLAEVMYYVGPGVVDEPGVIYVLALQVFSIAVAMYFPISRSSQILRDVLWQKNDGEPSPAYDGLLEAAGWSPAQWSDLRRALERNIRALLDTGWQVMGTRGGRPPVRFMGRRHIKAIVRLGTYIELGIPRDRIDIWSGAMLYAIAGARHPIIAFDDLGLNDEERRTFPSIFRCCPPMPGGAPGFVVLHELAHAAMAWEVRPPEPRRRDAPLFAIARKSNARIKKDLDDFLPSDLIDIDDVQLVLSNGFRPLLFDSQRLAQLSEPEDEDGLREPSPKPFAHLLDEGFADAAAAQATPLVRAKLPSDWLWAGDLVTKAYIGGATLLADIFDPDFDSLRLLTAEDPLGLLLARIEQRFGPKRAAQVRSDLLRPIFKDPRDPKDGFSPLFEKWRVRWLRPISSRA